ncbi:MAG: hypothetical protein ACI3XQ_06460 [Eubacteriales bacterium]
MGENTNENWSWLIIILFLFLFGFGGGGYGFGARNGAALTQAEMQQGFDTQEITRKLDGITNGLCQGFYAQNTTMLQGFAGVTSAVRDAQFAQQQCCCETNRNIDGVRYDGAKNTCDIITAANANTQKILDTIQGNRMAEMQNQINQLQLQAALCGVVRYPNSWSYNAGVSPFCGGNNCGNSCC